MIEVSRHMSDEDWIVDKLFALIDVISETEDVIETRSSDFDEA